MLQYLWKITILGVRYLSPSFKLYKYPGVTLPYLQCYPLGSSSGGVLSSGSLLLSWVEHSLSCLFLPPLQEISLVKGIGDWINTAAGSQGGLGRCDFHLLSEVMPVPCMPHSVPYSHSLVLLPLSLSLSREHAAPPPDLLLLWDSLSLSLLLRPSLSLSTSLTLASTFMKLLSPYHVLTSCQGAARRLHRARSSMKQNRDCTLASRGTHV